MLLSVATIGMSVIAVNFHSAGDRAYVIVNGQRLWSGNNEINETNIYANRS